MKILTPLVLEKWMLQFNDSSTWYSFETCPDGILVNLCLLRLEQQNKGRQHTHFVLWISCAFSSFLPSFRLTNLTNSFRALTPKIFSWLLSDKRCSCCIWMALSRINSYYEWARNTFNTLGYYMVYLYWEFHRSLLILKCLYCTSYPLIRCLILSKCNQCTINRILEKYTMYLTKIYVPRATTTAQHIVWIMIAIIFIH